MTKRTRLLAASLGALALTGCISPVAGPSGLYTRPIGGAPVTANPTPYSAALVCMNDYARTRNIAPPRIAVGRVLDYTGKEDFEGGRKVTQGASLMAISAFAKAGARLVERFDTSVSELELKYANNRLIGADLPGDADFNVEPDGEYRKILAGSIPGSDFYLVGGITELNSNLRSVGADAFIGDLDAMDAKGRAGAKLFVINVGVDLRLVETRTLEVVDVISYQKQIIGREISAGIFDFANNNVFDIGVGERAMEPIQLAVRSVIERAVLEMTANLYGANPASCGEVAADFGGAPKTSSVTGDFYEANNDLATNNGATRADPGRWSSTRDPEIKASLRGRSRS
ncbi:MAG: holdfast anchoring protein HfaB [Alphaproteobacteria bacterium]|nr:holdfast anchoring protein HfaB [Alphaproteobacteria bacterium]